MSKVFFISDHHFGHRGILKHEPEHRPFASIEEHDEWLVEQHNSVVGKNDTVWFGGDVAFAGRATKFPAGRYLDRMNGQKNLILGNHDHYPPAVYGAYFHRVLGCLKKGNVFVTHIPVHPDEFNYRVDYNLHGHIHSRKLVNDPRYINMCIEHCAGIPRTLEEWMQGRRLA